MSPTTEAYKMIFVNKPVWIPGTQTPGTLVDIRELPELPGRDVGIVSHSGISPVDFPVNLTILKVRGKDGSLQSFEQYQMAGEF